MDANSLSELGGVKILLCDDSAVERNALAHYLRNHDYIVDEVGDGEAALEYLKNKQVDLMLLDLHMPQRDGFGVLSYVQEHRRALPVILLSGLPPDQIQHRMNKLPDRELPPLFIKPVDPEKLVQVIELQLAGELPKANEAHAE
ncbi:MAG TPA: response regulator [Tepidisphaeraceae bacterium]|jgi:CheY-like chemotaxis protein